ncbi:MAG: hypothetical protein HXY46_08060 [Syntrophaceae bacterium]|nr:hypothetical protein [Syntrophaceae bacterium]
MTKNSRVILMLFIVVGITMFKTLALSKDIPMVTIYELRGMLDNPDLTLIDVRYDKDWEGSDIKIKSAVREDYRDVKSWADKYPKYKLLVLY